MYDEHRDEGKFPSQSLSIPTAVQLYPLSLLSVSGASAVAASPPTIARVAGCQ